MASKTYAQLFEEISGGRRGILTKQRDNEGRLRELYERYARETNVQLDTTSALFVPQAPRKRTRDAAAPVDPAAREQALMALELAGDDFQGRFRQVPPDGTTMSVIDVFAAVLECTTDYASQVCIE